VQGSGKRRVVVTGIGLLTSIGSTKESFWEALISGKTGVKRIPEARLDTSSYRTKIAATIDDFNPKDFLDVKNIKRMDPCALFGIAATTSALQDSALSNNAREEAGVILGSAVAGIVSHDNSAKELFQKGYRYVNPLTVPLVMYNAAASNISLHFGLKGISYALATACSSGSNAIGESYQKIKNGYQNIMVTGGSDATISPIVFSGWNKLRALSPNNDDPKRACKPFSKNRDGLVIGEGAGIVILESLESALARDARIYCEVIGYGATSDAFHITYPNQAQEVRAIKMALDEAGIGPGDVDYISAHGTATRANDKVETETLKEVWGDKAYSVPISSIKPNVGHTFGASGAIEFITCILAMENSVVPPTINYEEPDPECDLDYVPNTARDVNVNIALTNSFGFGGANSTLVLKKWNGSDSEDM